MLVLYIYWSKIKDGTLEAKRPAVYMATQTRSVFLWEGYDGISYFYPR